VPRQIGRKDGSSSAARPDSSGHLRQSGLVAATEGEVDASSSQCLGNGAAEAAGGAREQRSLPVQVAHRACPGQHNKSLLAVHRPG
jgi:hypothetical protein